MKRALVAGVVALWATVAAPQNAGTDDSATFSLDEARLVARQALHNGQFELARQIAMGLLQADAKDPFAYGVLAAAHSRLDDPRLARAAARLSYRYSETDVQKFGAARTAASVAAQQERPTASQAWLRIAATHADTPQQDTLVAREYARARAANPLRFNINLSVAPSDNVNNGTDNVLEVINGVPTLGQFQGSSRALSGTVGVLDVQLRYRLRADQSSRTTANARLYTRRVDLSSEARTIAPNVTNSDFASTYAELGVNHQFALGAAGNAMTLGAAFGASWSGGNRSYDFAKVLVQRDVRLSPNNRLSLSGVVEQRLSAVSSLRDANVLTLGANLGHKLAGGDRLSIGVTVQDVSGDNINADFQTASLRARYTFAKQVGPVQVTTGLTYGYTDYDSYVLVRPVDGGRQDTSLYGDVSLFFADYDFAGFAPTVQVRTGRRSSNVNRFEISETTISLGIQSKF
ncbi:surface lipoprotein assembly modifier [uncultured Tateyamaria sp.]|uniref:surface lipoprotein assembly modifier n=1 Tax=uncultured Tateyamaria sp. TaxID=455651 RepID=UPI002622D608|nr:surface lipoprotein assembly modifier [uncultured Tateyamaria sp.]